MIVGKNHNCVTNWPENVDLLSKIKKRFYLQKVFWIGKIERIVIQYALNISKLFPNFKKSQMKCKLLILRDLYFGGPVFLAFAIDKKYFYGIFEFHNNLTPFLNLPIVTARTVHNRKKLRTTEKFTNAC